MSGIAHSPDRQCAGRRSLSVFLPALTVAAVLSALPVFAADLPDTPERTFVTDGTVQSILRVDDTIYIGGSFTRVGPRTGPGVSLALDGSIPDGAAEISGAGPTLAGGATTGLRDAISDGNGGWYVSGLFTHVGSATRANIAHILADHTVDPLFNLSIDGGVNALALSGSTLYLGGYFTQVDGQPRANIASVDAVDGSLTAFDPGTGAVNSGVAALALSEDGTIVYVGGDFDSVGGQDHTGLAAVSTADGATIASFNPILGRGETDSGSVSALGVAGSVLYVGGNFDTVGGEPRRTIAALHAGQGGDGSLIPAFAPTPSYFGCIPCATVEALAISGSAVVVGGSFDTMGGASRANLAALGAADGLATAFNPAPDANILSLAASAGVVYAGGGFRTIGGQPRLFAAALDGESGDATDFDPRPNGSVGAIGASASGVYLGGNFSSLGGLDRHSLAAINAADGTPTAWDPSPEGSNGGTALVNTIALSGSTLYVGGYFTAIGGQERGNIAALNLVDGVATDWAPESNGVVNAILPLGDLVYAGGAFTSVGGQSRVFIAALSPADGSANDWDPSPDSVVKAFAAGNGTLYVGGDFFHISGEEHHALAAYNAADGTLTGWNPQIGVDLQGYTGVFALALAGDVLYAGGGFGAVQGATRNNIAGINIGDGSPTAFDPDAVAAENGNAYVVSLAVDGDTVYAGGYFVEIGGQPRGLLAGLKASDGSATAFNPNATGGNAIFALQTTADGTLYVGGSFPTFDLAAQQGFAVFSSGAANDTVFVDGFDGA